MKIADLKKLVESYKYCFLLNNNCYNHDIFHKYEFVAGFSNFNSLNETDDTFESIFKLIKENPKNFIIGYLSYDLKNEIEKLTSKNPDFIGFEKCVFIIPEILCICNENSLYGSDEIYEGFTFNLEKNFSCNFTRQQYLDTVRKIKEHIKRGDVYELNFCIEFYFENVEINPFEFYLKYNRINPYPFSCFIKSNDKYLLCSSPERFIAKRKNKIITQPIKGTYIRSQDEKQDRLNKLILERSEKDISENIMAVDVSRNDLSRVAKKGSVKVEELCKVYAFPNVYQMMSTITCELKSEEYVVDSIKYAFPMASMTGAPKIRAMQLIDEYETRKRGIYSGTVGYFDIDGDFDFNVVIRAIEYNISTGYLCYKVGSAITIDSEPEKEYEECLMKAENLFKLLK